MADLGTPRLRSGPTSRVLRRRTTGLFPEPTQIPQTPVPTPLDYSIMTNVTVNRNLAEKSVACFDDYDGYRSVMDRTSVYVEENPGIAATHNLFVDFLAAICSETSARGVQVLDQIAEFEQLVGDHYEVLRSITAKYPGAATRIEKTCKVKDNLKDERNTWRLLGKLYHDRLGNLKPNDDEEMEVIDYSEKRVVERLFRRDSDLREAQAVVDWLEANAADNMYKVKVDSFSDATVGWENTLNALIHPDKIRKSGNSMVSEMDPDAPRRNQKTLHDLDVQDQAILHDAIFLCLRSGMLEAAQDLCIKVGQPWRAATFEGWKLFHDPNYEIDDDLGKKFPCEGNKFRDVWKRSAWKVTEDEKLPVLERASYSAFCGNVRQLLSVCKTWDDCLWALTRCCVDVQVETEIRERMPRSFAAMPRDYWDQNKTSLRAVLEAMETLDIIRNQKTNAYRIIQKHLILGDFRGLLAEMNRWITEDEPLDPHLLRLLCHLVLVYRRLNLANKNDNEGVEGDMRQMQDHVIETYVEYLMETDRVQQVAWYTAQLPSQRQIDLYSKFLESVTVFADRKLCLDLAMESDLPLESITTKVVVNVRTREEASENEETNSLQPITTDRDRVKIDALSWLIFFESQRLEAMYQCNALIRSFIAAGKIEAAKEALAKIPRDSISIINDQQVNSETTIREFLCLECYLEAQEAFSDWFNHYSKGQPRKPTLNSGASFVEKVAFEQKEEQYLIDMERWNAAQLVQSREATERLTAVATFPHGWLTDEIDEMEEDDSPEHRQRQEEMEYLRRTCLPKLILLLHSVLHNTRQYQEAINLADLVAAERYGIYKIYSKEELRELLGKIRESSLAAMETGTSDPWGYPKK